MLILPEQIMLLLALFAPVFSERVFEWAKVLVVGAILAPRKRTVSAVLRVMGLSDEAQFQNYHRVLSRAKWNSLEVSKILLGLLGEPTRRWNDGMARVSWTKGCSGTRCVRARSGWFTATGCALSV